MTQRAVSPDPHSAATLRETLAAIDGAIYGDVFDCAVTEEELWRYSRRPISRPALRRLLDNREPLRGALSESRGLYCLAGREMLVHERPHRRRRALKLRRRARLVARLVQHVPFVRGLVLTGSVAAEDARPGADVDLLVIVAQGRMCAVFTLLGSVSRLMSRRLFCPNHYISEERLEITGRRDLYVAREVAQGWALTESSGEFFAANLGIRSELPNARARADSVRPVPGGRLVQRALEWPLRGRLGDGLERRLESLARARLRTHYAHWGLDVPEQVADGLRAGTELRFHGVNSDRAILEAYETRRSQVERLLVG